MILERDLDLDLDQNRTTALERKLLVIEEFVSTERRTATCQGTVPDRFARRAETARPARLQDA